MSAPAQAIGWRMPAPDRRAMLLDVLDVGRVTRRRGRIVLDFSPDLRDADRYLWTFAGEAFASEAEAEAVRRRICQDAAHLPLRDAIARYRGSRSRVHRATDVIDRYLEAARTTPSDRTGQLVRPRTLAAYTAVLRRARPFWEGMTIAELCRADTLRRLKGWFRLPVDQGGRGLESDQEARNCFAALRAVVAWYRTTRHDFPAPDWPSMPTAIVARRRSLARQGPTQRLSLPQVVERIEAIQADRRAIYWTMLYTGARVSEARGILGEDYRRPRLRICRSAEDRAGGCEIAATTKTGEAGDYTLPEWVCDLIDAHRRSIDPSAPLFQSRDPRAPKGAISEDALRDAWDRACARIGGPRVSLYRAMKHTQVGALRDAGIPIEDILAQYRWTSSAMLEHYDEAQDARRGAVVARLDEMVGKTRKGAE